MFFRSPLGLPLSVTLIKVDVYEGGFPCDQSVSVFECLVTEANLTIPCHAAVLFSCDSIICH